MEVDQLGGNSFIEAISSECVCFLGYSDCFGKLIFPIFATILILMSF